MTSESYTFHEDQTCSGSGELKYYRGPKFGNTSFLEGTASYYFHDEENYGSSSKTLLAIQSGQAELSAITWRSNWFVLISGYFSLLLIVIIVDWVFKFKDQSEEKKLNAFSQK